MKRLSYFLALVVSLIGCTKPPAQKPAEEPQGAHFKTGHGVGLPDPMSKWLGVKTADVTEQKIIPRIKISLHVVRGVGGIRPVSNARVPVEASGWITSEQAKEVRAGQSAQLLLLDGSSATGIVQRVEKAAFATSGDFEVAVSTETPLETGTPITAIIEGAPTGEVVAIPRTAVMKTPEGEFVYVVNEKYFARTPVKTGAQSDEHVEITDGLYAGDQIVVSRVNSLWMTELQALRGGKSCCAGH
jgi:multidrug efflux pump subunit AcrA (membrane-fusion protein)